MKLRIINTTDHKYEGVVFEVEGLPRQLIAPDGSGVMYVERIMITNGGFKFINSNYIVECMEEEE